jgi:heptose I phosphotransferase
MVRARTQQKALSPGGLIRVHANASGSDSLGRDQDRLIVSRDFWPLLQHNGLDTFDKIMAAEAGAVMRSVPGRRTVRMRLPSPAGDSVTVYLKRYHPEYLTMKRFVLRLLRRPGGEDEATREWRMIHALRRHGIGTAAPVAAGRSKTWGLITRSFVMTAEIGGGVPADEHVQALNVGDRRRFVRHLADLARKFHGQGFIHKDFYLSHIFVVNDGEPPGLFLIDLQRVLGPARFRERWLVKDIGSLAYSAQKAGVSRTDLVRFYKRYFEKGRLDQRDRRFIRKIMRRVRWLFGYTPRYGESPPR